MPAESNPATANGGWEMGRERIFYPRLLRILCYSFVPIIAIAYAALSYGLAIIDWKPWKLYDMVWMTGLGLIFSWVVYRCGSIKATPTAEGLVVRNIFRTRSFEWAEIVSVRMGQSDSWAHLDLTNTDTYPVMAVQISDGVRGRTEYERLRRLIAKHTQKGLR